MKIILFQPQIPQNAGNVVRTCAVTGHDLIMIQPLFSTTDRWLKRAGLDYWEGVNVQIFDDLEAWLSTQTNAFYFFSSKRGTTYTQFSYTYRDSLIFGSETTGLPLTLLERYPERCATIPMRKGARCLNLATSVGLVVYEVERQNHYQFPA